jgi:hypothetical protein
MFQVYEVIPHFWWNSNLGHLLLLFLNKWWFPKIGVPQVIIHFRIVLCHKPSSVFWVAPWLWKPPNHGQTHPFFLVPSVSQEEVMALLTRLASRQEVDGVSGGFLWKKHGAELMSFFMMLWSQGTVCWTNFPFIVSILSQHLANIWSTFIHFHLSSTFKLLEPVHSRDLQRPHRRWAVHTSRATFRWAAQSQLGISDIFGEYLQTLGTEDQKVAGGKG